MFRNSIVSRVFLALLLASSLLTAQNPPNHRVPKITASHPEWKASPQELFAPYWTLEPGWSTELEVRNNVPWHDLHVTPVLRTHDGAEVALMPVVLKPEEVAPINLREAVASAKPELLDRVGSFGSVVFRFEGTAPGNGFAAAVVRRDGRPIEFHFDSEGWGSTAVEGMWWLPTESSTAYLILSNPTSKPVTGKLTLSDAAGVGQQLSLTVGSRQSLRTNIREALHAPANGAFGGLSLSMVNDGEITATEIVFDEVSGQTAIMKLFDRQSLAEVDTVESRTLRAPMMALSQPDPSLGFPNGTVLDPKVFLRNAGPASTVVVLGVNWRNGGSSGTAPLPRITLLPGQMKVMNLGDFQKAGQIPAEASWGTVTLGYTGRSGDLVAVAMSYDKTSRFGLQTPFSEVMNSLLKGSMWHVDATHNTLITMGNGGTEPTRAQVTLFYNGGQSKYRVEQRLAPGQQVWLNLGDLLRNQVPDSDGKTIPPEVMFGSYELRDLSHPVLGLLYEGKLIVDKTYGHASYGCNHCCGYSQSKLSPNPFGGPPGIDNTDTYQSYSVCNAAWEDFDGGFNPHSTNTGVATLNGVLNLHTVAAGGATASAKNTLPFQANRTSNCVNTDIPGNQPVTVSQFNVAYSAYIPVDHVSAPDGCIYQGPRLYTYMGDANRGTYRTAESLVVIPDKKTDSAFFRGVGQTRNYGANSPANGSTLSAADEDGVALDCHLWNNSGTADVSGLLYDVTFPYSHQAQVHFDGSASNPLESSFGSIQWDMRTVIDTSNPLAPTALVNYNHTCYPSHQVKVNGAVVYLYTPPENDTTYIVGCLTGVLSKVIGQQPPPITVPAN